MLLPPSFPLTNWTNDDAGRAVIKPEASLSKLDCSLFHHFLHKIKCIPLQENKILLAVISIGNSGKTTTKRNLWWILDRRKPMVGNAFCPFKYSTKIYFLWNSVTSTLRLPLSLVPTLHTDSEQMSYLPAAYKWRNRWYKNPWRFLLYVLAGTIAHF